MKNIVIDKRKREISAIKEELGEARTTLAEIRKIVGRLAQAIEADSVPKEYPGHSPEKLLGR